jgi:uncharacterized protein
LRVFLDTNVLVSALTTRGICADVVTVVLSEHELLVGETVFEELRRVLSKKMEMPAATIDEAEAFLRQEATTTSVVSVPELPMLRDPDDRRVVAEAVASSADVLVSGDHNLLDVAEKLPLDVVSPRGFWEKLHGRR